MENSDSDLDDLRRSLDDLDADLIRLLAERFRLTERVGQHKKAHDLPPVDLAREECQLERIKGLARESGLNPDLAHHLMRLIIDEVVRSHRAIASADA